ncbi:hypothetical protein [Streptacidiphilus monticola]|uniref:ScoMcrA-like SRA domain-containing protein n=1 Tax=Streptacidiphilus monticola TaxID=2161674 RepID=A0ABW1G9M5_9ACTN
MLFENFPPPVGAVTTRQELAQSLGLASSQSWTGGIIAVDRARQVLVFSDPAEGVKHGYTFDGWVPDGDDFGPLYLYTGAGPTGHQKLSGANAPLLTLAEKGRDLHLFVADGKVPGTGTKYQRYVGQMVMDRQPYEERWNVDREGALRRVYVFRMRPVDQQVVVHEQDLMPPAPRTTSLLIPATVNTATFTYAEQHSTDEATLGWQEPRVVRRREGALRTAFEERLVALGHEVGTYQLQIRGERGVFTTDLFDATDKVLFEAKSSSSRHAIREAVGQLMDYRRHISAPGLRCAVLLPERPNDDLQNFLQSVGIASVYRDGDDFAGYPLV